MSASDVRYELLGNGDCRATGDKSYENWYAASWEVPGLIFTDDPAGISCEQCQVVCDLHPECLGYDYYGCQDGLRCEGYAELLFSKGTRPDGTPPAPFKTEDSRGNPTAGNDYQGEGPILGIGNIGGRNQACFRKSPSNLLSPVRFTEGSALHGAPLELQQTFPLVASPDNQDALYEFVGNGDCRAAGDALYENWHAASWEVPGLTFTDDPAGITCEQCQVVCAQYSECLGYDYYGCQDGLRCEGYAELLFSKGTRPDAAPPAPFKTEDSRGNPTAGEDYQGEGPILVIGNIGARNQACFRKLSSRLLQAEFTEGSTAREIPVESQIVFP